MIHIQDPTRSDLYCSILQNKFSSRSRAWVELPLDTAGHPRVQARLDHSLLPEHQSSATKLKGPWDRSCMQTWFNDLLEVHVTDLPVRLSMSTVIGLTDLVEDEVIPQPLPMEVSCTFSTFFYCFWIFVFMLSFFVTGLPWKCLSTFDWRSTE